MLSHMLLSTLIVSVIPLHVIGSSFPACDEEWTRYGSKCYRLHREFVSLPDALDICSRSYRGELLTITSREEQRFLESYIQPTNFIPVWMAGIRSSLANHDGSFYWFGGQKFTYTNWREGEPNNYNEQENCVIMGFFVKDGSWATRWLHFRCDGHWRFVCQKRFNATNLEKDENNAAVLLSEETERTYRILADVREQVYERRRILLILVTISMSIIVFILIAYFCGQYKNYGCYWCW